MSTVEFTTALFRTAVRSLMNDAYGAVYGDTQVDQAFTQAIRTVGQRHRCFWEQASGNVTADQMAQSQQVTGEVIQIKAVIMGTGGTRRHLKAEDRRIGLKRREVSSDRPVKYWFEPPNLLYVYPMPSSAEAITVTAVVVPAETAWSADHPAEIEQLVLLECFKTLRMPQGDRDMLQALEMEIEGAPGPRRLADLAQSVETARRTVGWPQEARPLRTF